MCRTGYVTVKITYNYILYLLLTHRLDLLHEGNHGVTCDWWIQISANDTRKKKSLCLYNNIRWMLCLCGIRSQIFVTMEGEHSYGKETSAFYNNSTRTIQSLLCGARYITQVSLNCTLVYVVRLVYICTHLTADWYIYTLPTRSL